MTRPDEPPAPRPFRGGLTHWGAFRAEVAADGGLAIGPHPDDPHPGPLVGATAAGLDGRRRVAAPAVRRGWLRHGPGPSDARGEDDFVEVSWDRALGLLADELRRVRATHGNEAIFGGSYGWASAGAFHHAPSQLHRFLNLFGGCTSSRHTYSHGASAVLLPHLVGDARAVLEDAPPLADVERHAELVVAFGGLPAKNLSVVPGGTTRHRLAAHVAALGPRTVAVTPLRDDAPPGAEWLPIRPGTDVALMLGLAHTLLAEGLHDRAFLDRFCTGFDRFADYLAGHDADWAAGVTGVDAGRVRELARAMARRRTLVTVTWSLQRARFGEQPVWMGLTLAAMLGQLGLPGGGFAHGYGSMGDVGEGFADLPSPRFPRGVNPVRRSIPVARIADLLLQPGGGCDFDGGWIGFPDVRLVWWAGGNPFHHHQDLGRLRRAFRRVDTVVVQEPFWTATARHADLVLPSTVPLERDDLGRSRADPHLTAMPRLADPFGQARDDHAALADLADALGFRERFTEGRDTLGWLKHLYDGWARRLGEPVPSFAEFWQRGELALPRRRRGPTLFERFRADPDGHPLRTPSGRLEIFSEAVEGFGYPDCPGHPTWLEPEEWSTGFPLQLIANQPATRLHSQLDGGGPSLAGKVAGREPVWMHPEDAAARGVADGDLVRVFNDRGACLAGARLTDGLRPGVLRLATGAWFDPVPGTDPVLCAHGNPNVLTADVPTSRLAQACAGQHARVEVERWAGEPPDLTVDQAPPLG